MPIIRYDLDFVSVEIGRGGKKKKIVQVRSPLIEHVAALYFQSNRNFIGVRDKVPLFLGSAWFELNVPKFLYLTEDSEKATDFSDYGPEFTRYLLPELIRNSPINMIPTVQVAPGFDGPKYVLRLWLPLESALDARLLAWYSNNNTWTLVETDAHGFGTPEEAARVLRGEPSDYALQLSFFDAVCWGSKL